MIMVNSKDILKPLTTSVSWQLQVLIQVSELPRQSLREEVGKINIELFSLYSVYSDKPNGPVN